MSEHRASRLFAARPGDPDAWVRTPAVREAARPGDRFTARLTIDVTPDQRARIKIAAFQGGQTVADILRDLLAREFPPTDGATT
jgi:hypothetical protein